MTIQLYIKLKTWMINSRETEKDNNIMISEIIMLYSADY